MKTKFKETNVGMILEEWEELKLSEAVEVNPKRGLKKGVSTKKVSMDCLSPFNKKIQNFNFSKFSGGSKFINGDTLMARITPCLENGKTAFVDILNDNEVGFGSTEFIVLSGKSGKTTSDFVYYLSISPKLRAEAIKSMTGTSGRQRVQTNLLREVNLEIPSIPEQKATAKILSSLDDKIELLQKQNKTLEAIGQALFKHWFVDFEFPYKEGRPYKSSGGGMVYSEELEKEIPKGWRVSKIGTELKTILGGTPSTTERSYWKNGTIGWINSGKINEFRIIEPTAYITREAVNNSATKLLPKRTTVLAITGATLGQVSRIEIDTCANQSVIGILESKTISSEYIYFWIKYTISEIIRNQTGGAQQHINKNNVDNSTILIPSEKVIEDYQKIIKPIFDKISLACFESLTLSKTRDLLLPKLMSGKIRVPVEALNDND
jgi:type I restriction enzyme S subunit